MKVEITIDCKNAAFYDADTGHPEIGYELAHILRNLAKEVDPIPEEGDELPILDSNGNTVGKLIVRED